MNIAIVGCGFVADYYLKTLPLHPELKLTGVMDKTPERAQNLSQRYSVPIYETLDAVLKDTSVDIVLNLTNPRSHYEVSKACLDSNKHVYSEKPLATTIPEAKELVKLAKSRGLHISSAPCNVLSESAQTLWKALRDDVIGNVRLVYAEMDDGLIHKMPYDRWLSESGIPWPYKDEFEVGCTLEHAGYYVTWLTTFFGPAQTVTAFSTCLIADKETDVPLKPVDTPDFSVACIKFESGVVARLTCGIVAPHDHEFKVIGDKGVLSIQDCWFYGSPVKLQKMMKIRRKVFMNPFKQTLPMVKKPPTFKSKGANHMDFSRGVAEVAAAIKENRPGRLSADFSLHNNELVLAIQNSLEMSCTYKMTTTFKPTHPMPWAV
ncbi:MAG: Gfo/Idh/MocA family oxidoreductase [Cyanobacteria bacterium P01_H01_bin.21]